MKDLNEKKEFEKHWEDAFEGAEMQPSEGVWDKIDAALSKEEAGFFQRKAFLYKILAAASVAAVMVIGIFSANYYLDNESINGNVHLESKPTINSENTVSGVVPNVSQPDTDVLENEIGRKDLPSDNSTPADASTQVVVPPTDRSSRESNAKDLQLTEAIGKNSEATHGNTGLFGSPEPSVTGNTPQATTLISQGPKVNPSDGFMGDLTNLDKMQGILSVAFEGTPMEIDHIYRVPVMPRGASKEKKQKESGLFLAGLDFSTGVFDPNFQQRGSLATSSLSVARVESTNDQLASFNTANRDFQSVRSAGNSTKPEIAYSYGANVGFKLTNRIILQTGFGYRKANSTMVTNGFIEDSGNGARIPIVASYQYQLEGLSRVNKISETDLDNQYEFASVPLRAGYVVLDKKVNLTLMAGVSSEFFLNNQIVDQSDFFKTLNNSSGDDSPYKSVYFNGSLGTMLGYTIAKNYVVTLEPSYKFAINSFTKEDFYLNSLPSSFMVSFGVAYNFR